MKYDVVVIGGGAAGLLAAGRASELGARALLLEKNNRLGVKLLMTGHGRCNITNNTEDVRAFAAKFGRSGAFLFSALSRFGVKETIAFFESRGLATKIEKDNQVFPQSDLATDVLRVLSEYCAEHKVMIKTNSVVKSIITGNNRVVKLKLVDGQEVHGEKYIVATGGRTYPATGSTGDGYAWLSQLGHRVVAPMPALTPIIGRESWLAELEGVSLKHIGITAMVNDKQIATAKGSVIFTKEGISGPAVFVVSGAVGRAVSQNVLLHLDLLPFLSEEKLDHELQYEFHQQGKRTVANILANNLPHRLADMMVRLADINETTFGHVVSREARLALVKLLKTLPITVKAVGGFNEAMITSGGVALAEVNPKTMQSKIVENLYFAGEILDLDGPTGGYNLQVAWSTGFVAGEAAAV
ncbi:MAG: NAD(P)/FAD-dependent oxidoreductase [Candidatus Falkowbacteria bacterium]